VERLAAALLIPGVLATRLHQLRDNQVAPSPLPPPASVDDRYSFRSHSIRIPPNDFHNKSFPHELQLIIGQPGKTRGGYDYRAAQARLKMEDYSSGWLRRVRPAVGAQGRESEVRILVHKTSIFGAQGQVSRQGIIGAAAVQEGAPSLSAGAGHRPARIAGGIKEQTAAPSQHLGTHPHDGQWKVHHQIARDRVRVGLDSGFSETTKILLRISVETIIPFRREPTVDVITVSRYESTGF